VSTLERRRMTKVQISADVRVTQVGGSAVVDRRITGPALVFHHPRTQMGPDVIFLVNQTAGLFGGDREDWHVAVAPGVSVVLTDPGPVRLFPGSGRGVSRTRIEVATGSTCLLLPHPLLPTRGSDTSVEVSVDVAPGGQALVSGIVCPGRVARGEGWGSSVLSMVLTLSCGGRPLFVDALRVGSDLMPRSGHLLTVAAVGPALDEGALRDIRLRIGDGSQVGLTQPEEGLLLVAALCATQQAAVKLLRTAADGWLEARHLPVLQWQRLAY
jgi:urease accessory protein UreH